MGTSRQNLGVLSCLVVLILSPVGATGQSLALSSTFSITERVSNPGPDRAVDQLLRQAETLYDLKDYGAARDLYHQALERSQSLGYRLGVAVANHYIARIHLRQGDYTAAIAHNLEVLDVLLDVASANANKLRADTNFQLAKIYASVLDNSLEALPFLEAALAYYQQLEAPSVILGDALNGLGYIHGQLGALGDSLQAYRRALAVYQTFMDLNDQAAVLNNLGGLHVYLGEYVEAQLALEEALQILEDIPDYEDYRVSVLNNLGWLYERQHRYDDALVFYQQAKTIREGLDFGISFSRLLSNIAYVHAHKNELDVALTHYRQALMLTDGSPQIAERIEIFNGIGTVYARQENDNQVWVSYHQSLRLAIQAHQTLGQSRTWTEFGRLFQRRQQPLVAIAFYKQAINTIEPIRENLRSLPLETQQRYTQTVAASYRELAALLLEQERVFEAQQVLDLLKIQELEDYLYDVKADFSSVDVKLPYLAPERILLDLHAELLLGNRSETDPVLSLTAFLQHPDVADVLATLQQVSVEQQPESLQQLQQKLQSLPQPSVVLYPLVLKDRLELLLVPPVGPPIHKTAPVGQPELKQQVDDLRTQLSTPSGEVKALASNLHNAIINPFQETLKTLEVKNIIYIPDNVLHYIPLSVLYDSQQQQWLIENYTSHNLTASSIGDLTQPPQTQFNILAGAFADAEQKFEQPIGRWMQGFSGLPYAGREVSFLQDTMPTTQVLLNNEFNRNNLETQLQGHNVLHLATHAAFVPGRPEKSFILLGDGDTITLKDLRNWSLPHVDLVVLSACQTGLSHIGDGVEILGMGFQVQRTEARSALASLWWVNDHSTSQLMQQFYTELATGATKVDALRQAQLHLIANGQDEPFHWAPFVLIGNGL